MKKLMSISIGIVMVIIVVLAFFISVKAAPFEPLIFHDAYFLQEEICPLDEVELVNDVEVKPTVYNINSAEGFALWRDKYDNRPFGGSYFREDLAEKPRIQERSITRRAAPSIPGEWYAVRYETVQGDFMGISKTQTVEVVTSNTIKVLDYSDPKCERRG